MGELAVAKYFSELGYQVYINIGGKGKTDLVVEKDKKTSRVQVKSCRNRTKNGKGWIVKLATSQRNNTKKWQTKFDEVNCDILAVYIIPEDRVVLLEPKKIKNKINLTIKGAG